MFKLLVRRIGLEVTKGFEVGIGLEVKIGFSLSYRCNQGMNETFFMMVSRYQYNIEPN